MAGVWITLLLCVAVGAAGVLAGSVIADRVGRWLLPTDDERLDRDLNRLNRRARR